MRTTKEINGKQQIVTVNLSIGDVLLLCGAFVLVVAAVAFGLIKLG